MLIDTLLVNADVITIDHRLPRAAAVGIVGERVVFVGDAAEAADLSARRTIDLGGRTVVPGFNDAHSTLR